MQHNLSSQYELAWAVADLVATHGTHDFRPGESGVTRVVWLCGLKVYFENHLPKRFSAPNLDLTLVRAARPQPFAATLSGLGFRALNEAIFATYTLRFDRGDLAALRAWQGHLEEFVNANRAKAAA